MTHDLEKRIALELKERHCTSPDGTYTSAATDAIVRSVMAAIAEKSPKEKILEAAKEAFGAKLKELNLSVKGYPLAQVLWGRETDQIIEAVLVAADQERETVAWVYEAAASMANGQYTNWKPAQLSFSCPCVPEGSIRNLRRLVYKVEP